MTPPDATITPTGRIAPTDTEREGSTAFPLGFEASEFETAVLIDFGDGDEWMDEP